VKCAAGYITCPGRQASSVGKRKKGGGGEGGTARVSLRRGAFVASSAARWLRAREGEKRGKGCETQFPFPLVLAIYYIHYFVAIRVFMAVRGKEERGEGDRMTPRPSSVLLSVISGKKRAVSTARLRRRTAAWKSKDEGGEGREVLIFEPSSRTCYPTGKIREGGRSRVRLLGALVPHEVYEKNRVVLSSSTNSRMGGGGGKGSSPSKLFMLYDHLATCGGPKGKKKKKRRGKEAHTRAFGLFGTFFGVQLIEAHLPSRLRSPSSRARPSPKKGKEKEGGKKKVRCNETRGRP